MADNPGVEVRLRERLERQHSALLLIGRNWRRYEAVLDSAMHAITESAADALQVGRASVWLYSEERRSITCRDLFEAAARRHSRGLELSADEYPAYFKAMESEEIIDAEDAHQDPRTMEFSAGYLAPLDIGAMLDAPIRLGGRLVGVLCNEFLGGPRKFHADEINTAAHLANLVSLALEFQQRNESESRLEQSNTLMRAILEATGEGIAAVNEDGAITHHNQRFLELLNLTPQLLRDTREALLSYVANQTTDPGGFRALVAAAVEGGETETRRTIELRCGRILDVLCRRQIVDDWPVGRVWSFRDVTEQKRTEISLRHSEERLRELAIRDALTGLYNRRFLEEALQQELARVRRYGGSLGILMLDVDHFKAFNDRHGHDAGDEVLKQIGGFLRGNIRSADIPCRYGGEEFLVILTQVDEESVPARAEELRRGINTIRIRHRDQDLGSLTISLGAALAPHHGESVDGILKAADLALYTAKEQGRNCVVMAG